MAVGIGGPMYTFQNTAFLEAGEEILPIRSLQPARFKLQAGLSGRLVSQIGECDANLAPQTAIDGLLRAHMRAVAIEIEFDGCNARVDRLEQGGQETVQIRTLRVAGDQL